MMFSERQIDFLAGRDLVWMPPCNSRRAAGAVVAGSYDQAVRMME